MHRLLHVLLLLLAVLPPARAASADDLLEPDKAFRFSARALDARTVEVLYGIADGYYLYRERFRFVAEPATVRLAQPHRSGLGDKAEALAVEVIAVGYSIEDFHGARVESARGKAERLVRLEQIVGARRARRRQHGEEQQQDVQESVHELSG